MTAQNAAILRTIIADWQAAHAARPTPPDLTSRVANNAGDLQGIDVAWRTRFTAPRLAEDPDHPGLFVATPSGPVRFLAAEDPQRMGLWPVTPGSSLAPDGAHEGLYLITD